MSYQVTIFTYQDKIVYEDVKEIHVWSSTNSPAVYNIIFTNKKEIKISPSCQFITDAPFLLTAGKGFMGNKI